MSNSDQKSPGDILERLTAVIEARRGDDPDKSYVAKRFKKGREKIAQKVGEEAVEAVIAAVGGKKGEVISESADLLFHLLIMWADAGVTPAEVMAELEKREGASGIIEKKNRKKK